MIISVEILRDFFGNEICNESMFMRYNRMKHNMKTKACKGLRRMIITLYTYYQKSNNGYYNYFKVFCQQTKIYHHRLFTLQFNSICSLQYNISINSISLSHYGQNLPFLGYCLSSLKSFRQLKQCE